jgi:hypothetical protein
MFKKLFSLSLACALIPALAACTTTIKSEKGADRLVQVQDEPIGCQFLYKLESEVSVYNAEDARRYLENRIADQARRGNAYWITSMRTRPNEWVVFGPERAYVLIANVYRCPEPNNIVTGKGLGTEQSSSAYMYGTVY